MTKTFAGFILGNKSITQVRAVALYVERRSENKGDIKRRIEADFTKGAIDAERRDTLMQYLELCWDAYVKIDKLVDERDPRDWESLGNGARRKKVHKDSEVQS